MLYYCHTIVALMSVLHIDHVRMVQHLIQVCHHYHCNNPLSLLFSCCKLVTYMFCNANTVSGCQSQT